MTDVAELTATNQARETQPKPKSIVVEGRRWFNKSKGSTYHSARIIVDGVDVEGIAYAYGYGDHYICNAACKLDEQGYMPGREYKVSGSHESLYRYCERMGITLNYTCSDVKRKKDL